MSLFHKHDWTITIITWVLVAVGIITIYSITYKADSPVYGQGAANRQLIFALLGLGIYVVISTFLDYTYLKSLPVAALLYFIVTILLILVLLLAQDTRGSARWIPLGPLNLEPSELGKVVVIIISALFFSKKLLGELSSLKLFLICAACFAPIIGLIFKQPDLGTTMSLFFIIMIGFFSSVQKQAVLIKNILSFLIGIVLGGLVFDKYEIFQILRLGDVLHGLNSAKSIIILASLFIFGVLLLFSKRNFLLILVVLCAGIFSASGYSLWYNSLKVYQCDRIDTFINPSEFSTGAGYQVNQSVIAVGSGQIVGRGFGRGTQSNLNFLPERHTDFIFASFAEEFGFIGACFLIVVYTILILKIVYVGISSNEPFGFLLCIGVAAMILFQFAVNVGMNIGIMPVTGITLPLFSYGGSSLLTTLLGISLVQSVAKGRELIDIEDSFINREASV